MSNPFKPTRKQRQRDRAARVFSELMKHVQATGQVPSPEEDCDTFDAFCDKLLKTISIIDQKHEVTVMPAQLKKRIRERMPEINWPAPPTPRKPKWED